MKIRRIDIEGSHGSAMLSRDDERKDWVALDITTPGSPYFYVVYAADPEDRREMAGRLQELLEGFVGGAADIAPYATLLDLIATC